MSTQRESIFTMEATPIKFGAGAINDAGWELKRLGVTRALLVTDPGVAALGIPDRVRESIEAEGIEVVVYDRSRVEPTLESLQEAADFAREAKVDGFVSVGGGSSMDTAKVATLVTTHPAPILDYVNAPVGKGLKPPSPLLPHLAIPTTSGTGAEATTVAVLDIPELKVKTGISHRYLRPAQGIVDPELTRTLPAEVTSSADSTSSAMRPRASSHGRTTSASSPPVRAIVRPTRAPTRSPTCGPRRRSTTAASTSGGRSPTRTTPRPAAS